MLAEELVGALPFIHAGIQVAMPLVEVGISQGSNQLLPLHALRFQSFHDQGADRIRDHPLSYARKTGVQWSNTGCRQNLVSITFLSGIHCALLSVRSVIPIFQRDSPF